MEEICGIRVAAVAPGLVRTPLWLDSPHKLRMVEEDKDEWVIPGQVAQVMLSIIEDDEISTVPAYATNAANSDTKIVVKGGIILEVTSREVPLLNKLRAGWQAWRRREQQSRAATGNS